MCFKVGKPVLFLNAMLETDFCWMKTFIVIFILIKTFSLQFPSTELNCTAVVFFTLFFLMNGKHNCFSRSQMLLLTGIIAPFFINFGGIFMTMLTDVNPSLDTYN